LIEAACAAIAAVCSPTNTLVLVPAPFFVLQGICFATAADQWMHAVLGGNEVHGHAAFHFRFAWSL
jgi:hypothetical protein